MEIQSHIALITVVDLKSDRNRVSADVPAIKRTVQLTNWTGLDIYPAPSPDGNSVAYSSDHGGGFEVRSESRFCRCAGNQTNCATDKLDRSGYLSCAITRWKFSRI